MLHYWPFFAGSFLFLQTWLNFLHEKVTRSSTDTGSFEIFQTLLTPYLWYLLNGWSWSLVVIKVNYPRNCSFSSWKKLNKKEQTSSGLQFPVRGRMSWDNGINLRERDITITPLPIYQKLFVGTKQRLLPVLQILTVSNKQVDLTEIYMMLRPYHYFFAQFWVNPCWRQASDSEKSCLPYYFDKINKINGIFGINPIQAQNEI